MRLLILFLLFSTVHYSQNSMVTYFGNHETILNDVCQISNGDILIIGKTKNLATFPSSVTRVILTASGITNTTTDGSIPFILQFNQSLQIIKKIYHLPVNSAIDFRFIKTSNLPRTLTQNIYLSGETSLGYFVGKLNNNFINGDPTGFQWVYNVNAASGSYPKLNQPWDVGSDDKVVYARGDSHAFNWSCVERLNQNGVREVVPSWLVHWPVSGGEYYGNANNYVNNSNPSLNGISGLSYSAIVFKRDDNRCNLRSQNQIDFDTWSSDGNGGQKKGKWPMDVFYSTPCTPSLGPNTHGGYTGYRPGTGTTYGPNSICIDKRNNNIFIGFNTQSTLPDGLPDFEPAVMAMDSQGELLWWSRLYYEKRPDGTLQRSTPDQYIDDLAIDYVNDLLTVVARCHGNNVENFWDGNEVDFNSNAQGFQNRFTGNNGNIHIQWIGKLSLSQGVLNNCTYWGEYNEGASSLGNPLTSANLNNWPNPNLGWPDLNTTRAKSNSMKVTSDGSVLVLGKGRRTMTTSDAYQSMPLPNSSLKSCWNSFVRLYNPVLSFPLYSSLLVGNWDTSTGSGGDNVNLNGSFKTDDGIIVVGNHTGINGQLPTSDIPSWGRNSYITNTPTGVIAYLRAISLVNPQDSFLTNYNGQNSLSKNYFSTINPVTDNVNIFKDISLQDCEYEFKLFSVTGTLLIKNIFCFENNSYTFDSSILSNGIYILRVNSINDSSISQTFKIIKK